MQTQAILDQPLAEPLPARAGTRRIDAEMLLSIPQFSLASIATVDWLDNRRIVVSLPPAERGGSATVQTLDVDNGATIALGEGAWLRPSPDGRWVACVRGDGTESRLWLVASDGSSASPVEAVPAGAGVVWPLQPIAWSPDSTRLVVALTTDIGAPELLEATKVAREQPRGEDAPTSAIEGEDVLAPPPPTEVLLIDVATGAARSLATTDEPVRSISWLPGGEEIVFERIRLGWYYNEPANRAWVQAMRVDDGSIRTLATFDGMQQVLRPVPSPRGDRVAITYDADNPDYNYLTSLGLVSTTPPQNGAAPAVVRLTQELKLGLHVWAPDGTKLFAMRVFGAYNHVYAVDAATGDATPVTAGPFRVTAFSLSPDGTRLVWVSEDLHGTRRVSVGSSSGGSVSDLLTLPSLPADWALGEVREVDWEVADYPARMRGALILPLDYTEGTRFPLLVDVHGGGPGASIHFIGGIVFAGPAEWHHWAALGYGVLVPEFRSSCAFGHLAITRDQNRDHNLIDRDVADISAGVDGLVDAGLVDPARTAFIGMSAGAVRANWATVATHRFAAVVSYDGWADEWFAAGVYRSPAHEVSRGGPAVAVPESYTRNSALFHALGADTPTLFLMGNPRLGSADHHLTVRWLYNALRAQGVPAQYVQYPDEGHGCRRSANVRDTLERTTRWLQTHMAAGRA